MTMAKKTDTGKSNGTWGNILRSMANPAKNTVILHKIARRLHDRKGALSAAGYADWLASNAVDEDAFVQRRFDPTAIAEATAYADALNTRAGAVLADIPYNLGGGGAVRLLYLLTRLKQPETVVETGVASGFSSACILSALHRNDKGRLYSSDFPYFRIANAERYIGIMVDEALKDRWTLMLDGDEANIPRILDQIESIDLLHYDSDKTYAGREHAMARLMPRMAKGGIVVMDDIQDNCFFHDFAGAHPAMRCEVVRYRGKHIGILNLAD